MHSYHSFPIPTNNPLKYICEIEKASSDNVSVCYRASMDSLNQFYMHNTKSWIVEWRKEYDEPWGSVVHVRLGTLFTFNTSTWLHTIVGCMNHSNKHYWTHAMNIWKRPIVVVTKRDQNSSPELPKISPPLRRQTMSHCRMIWRR